MASSSPDRHCMVCVSVSERDAFDTLFDHAPDKLNVVKKVGLWHLGQQGLELHSA